MVEYKKVKNNVINDGVDVAVDGDLVLVDGHMNRSSWVLDSGTSLHATPY